MNAVALLVLGYGNALRTDDGAGPAVVRRLADEGLDWERNSRGVLALLDQLAQGE